MVVAHFDSDSGEVDTYLGMEPIYSESADGSTRLDYGAKFNSVATIKLSVIKQDGGDFSVAEVRDVLKWTTGSRTNSTLDLVDASFEKEFTDTDAMYGFALPKDFTDVSYVYINNKLQSKSKWKYIIDEENGACISFGSDSLPKEGAKIRVVYNRIKYSFIGRITNAWQQKMDARTTGLVFEFTSISPWAYSPVQTITNSITSAGKDITIKCDSDDLYGYVYPNITYKKTGSKGSVTIKNSTTGDETKVYNIAVNEVIDITDNMMITSDKTERVFGADFNFVFPRLKSGSNIIKVTGEGSITFTYRTPIKVGDCAMDINIMTDQICDPSGNIQLDTLPWNRISNTPTTLSGYGISDAYTKASVYTKSEVNNLVDDAKSVAASASNLASSLSSALSSNYYKKTSVYTKQQVDNKVSQISERVDNNTKSITDTLNVANSAANLASNTSSNLTNNYYKKGHIDDNYYTKGQIDDIVSGIKYDGPSGENNAVTWSEIANKPTTLSGYGVLSEVQQISNNMRNQILENDVYTKQEIYTKQETYTKAEVDAIISNFSIDNVYTKQEVDELVASASISINEEELNNMLNAILI